MGLTVAFMGQLCAAEPQRVCDIHHSAPVDFLIWHCSLATDRYPLPLANSTARNTACALFILS
jgi:hypothetical protein